MSVCRSGQNDKGKVTEVSKLLIDQPRVAFMFEVLKPHKPTHFPMSYQPWPSWFFWRPGQLITMAALKNVTKFKENHVYLFLPFKRLNNLLLEGYLTVHLPNEIK